MYCTSWRPFGFHSLRSYQCPSALCCRKRPGQRKLVLDWSPAQHGRRLSMVGRVSRQLLEVGPYMGSERRDGGRRHMHRHGISRIVGSRKVHSQKLLHLREIGRIRKLCCGSKGRTGALWVSRLSKITQPYCIVTRYRICMIVQY